MLVTCVATIPLTIIKSPCKNWYFYIKNKVLKVNKKPTFTFVFIQNQQSGVLVHNQRSAVLK